jgi:RNA-binding protein YhbY
MSSSSSSGTRAKSPPRFGASDFKKKKIDVAGNRSNSNAAKIAKFRGLKVDFSDLSNREITTNFKIFGVYDPPDRQRFQGASATVEGKKLVADDISVTAEFLRRNLEVQSFSIINCGITDAMFAEIADGLIQVRQLKKLTLSQNLLTVKSTDLIVKLFSKKKVEVLDVRGNNVTFEEGKSS